tara:strand:- start:381 stop:611 length:231 start_codon:yes stop_codon:yes gene_type:complete
MSRGMTIIIVLLLITITLSFWYGRKKAPPPWMKCKESLFSQVILNKCTPSILAIPDSEFEKQKKEQEDIQLNEEKF